MTTEPCQHNRLRDKFSVIPGAIFARCVDCGKQILVHVQSTELAAANDSVTINGRYPLTRRQPSKPCKPANENRKRR